MRKVHGLSLWLLFLSLKWLLLLLLDVSSSSSSFGKFCGCGADAFLHRPMTRIFPARLPTSTTNILKSGYKGCKGLGKEGGVRITVESSVSHGVIGSVVIILPTWPGGGPSRSSSTTCLQVQKNDEDNQQLGDDDGGGDSSSSSFSVIAILDALGLVSQPIVWISLYCVATTGAGLPSGPFGLIGGIEGISYLFVVGYVIASLVGGPGGKEGGEGGPSLKLVESLSWLSLGAGLFTLCVLVAQQGCIPNAKPILDYSAYLPVCEPDKTPGFFGG